MAARATTAEAKARQGEQSKAVQPVSNGRVLAKLPTAVEESFASQLGLDSLDSLTSYEQAMALLEQHDVQLPEVPGDRPVKIADLVGVGEMIVVDFRVLESDQFKHKGEAATFVYCAALVKSIPGVRVGFATGAYGIVKRVEEAIARGIPMFKVNDVTLSEFETVDDNGAKIRAKSYWFN